MQSYHLCWGVLWEHGRVLFELCGVLQQVFICQFPGSRCPLLLKTSHGISWRCHGLDTTSHTYTHLHVCLCLWHKVPWSADIYHPNEQLLSKVHMQYCLFWSLSHFGSVCWSWFLCICSDVQTYNSPLCRQTGSMCFAVTCGVVVSKWWLRERACLACMSFCLRGSSHLSPYLFFSASSPHLTVSACTPVCLHSSHFIFLPSSLFCFCRSGLHCQSFPSVALFPLLNQHHSLMLSISILLHTVFPST